jgi:hypothetical protein
VDWNAIKKEYITTDMSYRDLCAKYGVNQTTLCRHAKDENWVALRAQMRNETEAKLIEEAAKQNSKIDTKYYRLVDKLMDKAEQVIDNTPVWQVQSIKDMASALKSLKECRGAKTDADIREQEARIKSLEKAVEKTDEVPQINVVFESGEDYGK